MPRLDDQLRPLRIPPAEHQLGDVAAVRLKPGAALISAEEGSLPPWSRICPTGKAGLGSASCVEKVTHLARVLNC